ncbi:MAG TPA: restriction endonuclease subunit S [Allosphingosinicella sp.]|jgi:type I restriction enzyme S subunit
MANWRTEALSDCLQSLIDYRGKSPPKSLIGVPVLSAKVVKTAGLKRPIEQTIDPSYYSTWMTRGLPKAGDIVMTTEAPLGEVIQLDEETSKFALGQRIVCMRGKAGKLDNTFFRYLLTSPAQQKLLASYATGTTVLGISQKALRALPIRYPDFEEQKRIGELLSFLDDRIELNRRMNETLEAMARAIFKDWFVDFGPTRAKMEGGDPYLTPEVWSLFPDRLDDDERPVGWRIESVYDFASVIYGAPFASSRFNADCRGLPLIRIRDLATHEPSIFTDEEHPKGHKVYPGDLVVGMDGEFRLHVWKGETAWLNQRVCSFVPKVGVPASFLSEALKEPLAFFERGKVGTTVIHLGKADIDTFRLIKPSGSLLAAYGALCHELIQRTVTNALENRTLAATRDLLLPKLMSGEIRIRDAEAMVADAA